MPCFAVGAVRNFHKRNAHFIVWHSGQDASAEDEAASSAQTNENAAANPGKAVKRE